jgi:hypothetical protein
MLIRHPELVSVSIYPHKPGSPDTWMLKHVQHDGVEMEECPQHPLGLRILPLGCSLMNF